MMMNSDVENFVFNDTATTEIYTHSLHDALPIWVNEESNSITNQREIVKSYARKNEIELVKEYIDDGYSGLNFDRSEEHTSELQSRQYLVCRLLLEKKLIFHLCYFLLYSFF